LEILKSYIPTGKESKRILSSIRRYLKSLQKIEAEPQDIEFDVNFIKDENWGENWKRFFKPLRIGERFVVKPPWRRSHLKSDEICIDINPGMAFGTGNHPTTKLCLKALERRLVGRGYSVLDVGTGSGILAIASARLGAKKVVGLDIDEKAIEMARENVENNKVRGIVTIRKGSIGIVKGYFDLVLANLDFKGLIRMRVPLIRRIKRNGILIISGILVEEEERIRNHYEIGDILRWVETEREGEWVCMTFKRES
jgi:ribosomal protein L11 methyltransferase